MGRPRGFDKDQALMAKLGLKSGKAVTAKAARVDAPEPIYEKSICLDLLKAKMEAMDRGGVSAGLRVPQAEVCARCRAVFREFDLAVGDVELRERLGAVLDAHPRWEPPEHLRAVLIGGDTLAEGIAVFEPGRFTSAGPR